MAVVRWSPIRDIMSVRDEMNRLFGEVFGRTSGGQEGSWFSGAWTPPVDIYETDEALILQAELPGISKDEVTVELKDNTLVLRGERKRSHEVKEENYQRIERTYGEFQRSFVLPTTVDQNRVMASFKDGVLELNLPKAEVAKPKRITISA